MTAEHRCEPVYDTAGNVVGRALVDPGMSDVGRAALAELVAAAIRYHDALEAADPEAAAVRAGRQERMRARARRWRGEGA